MSMQMLQSLGGMLSGSGVGQQATPGMQQALGQAMPGMTPQMAQGATVAGVQSGAPSAATAGLNPQDALYAQMAQNLQLQSSLAPYQGLASVGEDYLKLNTLPRQLAPQAPEAHTEGGTMGPLPFGSSQSPLLTYLSMLGAR